MARALYFTGQIGKEISEDLYASVAAILAYIFKIEKGEFLEKPEIEIPSDLQFDEFGNKKVEDIDEKEKRFWSVNYYFCLCIFSFTLSLSCQ